MRWCASILLAAAVGIVHAQPIPPILTLDAAGGGRFEFAAVPELVLVRGVPQTLQLGMYQIDPSNPWPAGDFERAGGWASHRPTRAVDTATGQPLNPSIARYDGDTGALTYDGTWSGDIDLRLTTTDGGITSAPFRVRVLTPTVVWGENAATVNAQRGWNARVCPSDVVSFSKCRGQFVGGASDTAPLVVFIPPGTYTGQDWFVSARRHVYVLGDPGVRPTLAGDVIGGGKKAMFYIANLTLRDVNIAHTGAWDGGPNVLIVRNVYQSGETGQQNGIVNPHTSANTYPWTVWWHASESRGMGGTGNTTHAAYVEGRPKTTFDVNAIRVLGTRGSSAIKTTMGTLNVRHSLLQVAEDLSEIENGVCGGATTHGCLMHTPVDVPGYTTAVIYANRFVLWRGPTAGTPVGRSGILAGAVFIRQRGASLGSDIPNYPNLSWNPPVSSQGTKQVPCRQWDPGAATFVADAFWADVRSVPLDSAANPCLFRHFIGFNTFQQVAGSLPVWALRDDGTYPARAVTQFSPQVIILRNHPDWIERSTSFWHGNTLDGIADDRRWKLNDNPNVAEVQPGAQWPRTDASDFPRVIEVTGDLPPWFKL